jgi:hypothetical protein
MNAGGFWGMGDGCVKGDLDFFHKFNLRHFGLPFL